MMKTRSLYIITAAVAVFIFWILIRSIGFSFDLSSLFSNNAQIEFADGDHVFAPLTSRDHRRGASDPLVTWVEYSDFECPYCVRFASITEEILAAYPYQVEFVYRHYPNNVGHEYAYEKAMASECAWSQGGDDAFWVFHDLLFENAGVGGGDVAYEDLPLYAEAMGLDVEEFAQCLVEESYGYRVTEDMLTGMNAGVVGTPTSYLVAQDGTVQIVPGVVDLEAASEIIDGIIASYGE